MSGSEVPNATNTMAVIKSDRPTAQPNMLASGATTYVSPAIMANDTKKHAVYISAYKSASSFLSKQNQENVLPWSDPKDVSSGHICVMQAAGHSTLCMYKTHGHPKILGNLHRKIPGGGTTANRSFQEMLM